MYEKDTQVEAPTETSGLLQVLTDDEMAAMSGAGDGSGGGTYGTPEFAGPVCC